MTRILTLMVVALATTAGCGQTRYVSAETAQQVSRKRGTTAVELADGTVLSGRAASAASVHRGSEDWIHVDGRAVHRDQIRSVTVKSRGRGAAYGALTGLVAGAVGGAISGYNDGDDDCNGDHCFFTLTAKEKAVFKGLAIGGIGAGAGAVLGLLIGVDRQFTVVGHSASVAVAPTTNGAQGAFTFSF